MREIDDCPYLDKCKEVYPGEEMDEYRKDCDCINCALCDRYWELYDKRHMTGWERVGKGAETRHGRQHSRNS